MVLLGHRRLVDVIIRRDAAIVSNLGQFLHIVHIVMADVDIEHDRVAVITLAFDQIVKLLLDRLKRLRQRLSFLDRIDRDVKRRDTRVAKLIDHLRLQQSGVGRQINKDVFLAL